MKTSFRGAYVISWSQTEIDGLQAAPLGALTAGACWSWTGDIVRVDGPSDVLRLERTDEDLTTRKCAAKLVKRLVKAARTDTTDLERVCVPDGTSDNCFVITNGVESFTVTLIEVGAGAQPLLMFLDSIPSHNTDFWVVHHNFSALQASAERVEPGGVICFTPGTHIETPQGPRLVEELREGDFVQTKDNGAQEVQWIGSRRMTGARLFAMPRLRPVLIRAGALGVERPDSELLVSPEHRLMIEGDVAQALFNTREVLIAAKDLVNDRTITVDLRVREVTYVHLLLSRHQILWANGVETESFHPASAALSALDDEDRKRLLEINPSFEHEPQLYGGFARRMLNASEATILKHESR